MEFKKNDIVNVTIEDISSEGEGIGKINGYPFFVKDAVIGDKAKVRVTKVKKNYSFGRLEEVLEPSPYRVEPVCAYHKQCGGCQIQAMSYERQLIFKQDKIKNNLIRIGGFKPEFVEPNILSDVIRKAIPLQAFMPEEHIPLLPIRIAIWAWKKIKKFWKLSWSI